MMPPLIDHAPSPTQTDPRRDVRRPDAQPFLWRAGEIACLLVHGLTSTPFEMRELGCHLHQAGYTVQGLLLPGHGTQPEDLLHIRWQAWSAAICEAVDTLRQDHQRVVLVGSSLGGSLCLWEGCSRPADGLVILGAPLLIPRWQRLARWLKHLRPMIPKRGGNSSIRNPEARALHPSYGAMVMQAVSEMNALLDATRPRLSHITAPLLLIHSRHDSTVSPASAIACYEAVGSQHKTLMWVENSDHIITEDNDKHLVFAAVQEFVAHIAGGRYA